MGFACGRAGGAGRAPLAARGNVGTVASKQWGGERVGRAPPSRPSPAPGASAPRNFRKHLRMVGSRRVKAQSKARERRGRAGARCSWPAGAWRAALCARKARVPRPRCSPAGTFRLPGSAPGQGPAPALRLRPCPPSTVLVRRRPSALPTPAPPAAVASSTLRTPSRSPRPPQPAPVPVHLVWLQAPPLTGSAFAAAFAERRERSFSRSWSDPTPMKADTSHDSRDSRCRAAQASTPLPEAPLGPQSCAPTPGEQLGFCAFAEPQFTSLRGGALAPPIFWAGVTKGCGSLAALAWCRPHARSLRSSARLLLGPGDRHACLELTLALRLPLALHQGPPPSSRQPCQAAGVLSLALSPTLGFSLTWRTLWDMACWLWPSRISGGCSRDRRRCS